MKLLQQLLELLNGTPIRRTVREFMQENGYSYTGNTIEELAAQHKASCKRSGRLSDADISLCKMLKIPLVNGKLA